MAFDNMVFIILVQVNVNTKFEGENSSIKFVYSSISSFAIYDNGYCISLRNKLINVSVNKLGSCV